MSPIENVLNKKSGKSKAGAGSSQSLGANFKAIGGVTLLEFAAVGAAAFVLWRNRERIQDFMEEHGVKIPAIFSEGLGSILGARQDQGQSFRQ